MAKFVPHKLTYTTAGPGGGAKDFYFLAAPDAYTNIGSEVGVTKCTTEDDISMPRCTVEALLGSSAASRLIVELEAVGGKARRREIICAQDKVDTAKTALLTKQIDGKNIKKIATPRRAVYK